MKVIVAIARKLLVAIWFIIKHKEEYQSKMNEICREHFPEEMDQSLESVIEYVVNSVGANLNTASWALLSHISGVRKNVAKNIVDYRKENGNFSNRKELKERIERCYCPI